MTTAILPHVADWQAADEAARRAERRVAPALDLYCQGLGRPPSAAAIAGVLRRQCRATQALRRVLLDAGQARSRLPLL
jgi:hypothetical protein